MLRGMIGRFAARALAVTMSTLLLLSPATHAASNGPPVPDPQDLMDLVRATVSAVADGNAAGDYSKLYDMGSADFQAANPKAKLAAEFAPLRASGVDLAATANLTPLTTRSPTLDRRGLLRILGYYEIAMVQLVYDVVYAYDTNAAGWRVAGIKLTPRDIPPQPKLMQPE